MKRRDIIKGLIAIPILGPIIIAAVQKSLDLKSRQSKISSDFDRITLPGYDLPLTNKEKTIRLGICGTGTRGKQLMHALGFPDPKWIDEMKMKAAEDPKDTRYEDYMSQEDLNVVINGICEVFDTRAQEAVIAASNTKREGTESAFGTSPKVYTSYKEMIRSPDIDAIVIATPDHHHVPMTIEAAQNVKHVYCEKPLSWSIPETFTVRNEVRKSNIVFQLGHQGRHVDAYHVAKQIYDMNMLGNVSLVRTSTNRNSPDGAWIMEPPLEANKDTIDWKEFIGQAPWHEFDLKRFFMWKCFWDYGNGISANLFSHDFDAINQIMRMGIPSSTVASGGIYFYKDGREIPDTTQLVFEFPDMNMTILHSATLSNSRQEGKVFMGHDATMYIDNGVKVIADQFSTRFRDNLKQGVIDSQEPIFSYSSGQKKIDAVTSATNQYYQSRGLYYAYRNNRFIDVTNLHLGEWLNCIRNGGTPSCNIDLAFEEAITVLMASKSYKEGRTIFWDKEKEEVYT
jgi:predicted dehydrogenase